MCEHGCKARHLALADFHEMEGFGTQEVPETGSFLFSLLSVICVQCSLLVDGVLTVLGSFPVQCLTIVEHHLLSGASGAVMSVKRKPKKTL